MTRSQRLTFLAVAAVIAVVALVTLAGDSETTDTGDEQAASQTVPTPTPTPEVTGMADPSEEESAAATTPEPTPEPLAAPETVLLTASGEAKTVRGTQGERVRFRVRSPVDEEVHVHGYDIERELPAGRAVTITIPEADLTGIYSVELHGSGQEIGSLRIEPR